MKKVTLISLFFLLASHISLAQVFEHLPYGSMPVGTKIIFQKTLVIPWYDRTPITFHSDERQTCQLIFSTATTEAPLVFKAGSKLTVTETCGGDNNDRATFSNRHVILTCNGQPDIKAINADDQFNILKIVVPLRTMETNKLLDPCR